MVEEAGAPNKDEMAEPTDLVVDVHDLSVHRIRIAGT
jgi:hypothetical protein